MRNLIKICTKCHSKRSHVVAKSKNLLSSWCRKAAIGAFVFGALLVACGDDNSGKNAGGTEEDSGIVAIADKTISGVSQKGPFVNGSSVTVQELDGESLAQTGASYEGKIKNDMGEFSVTVAKLASQYALLKANGFYRNEVTGEKSKSQVTLYALTDLSDRDEVNVNLLTHMEYERSLYLAAEGLSVGKAKKQAESEVLKSFGVEGDFAAAEDLSIFGTDEGAAALLAVSVLMQGDLSEADFSERLANYAADIEQDGKWDDFITATVIADWASSRSLTGALAAIRNNIAGWGLAADVPAFEKYVDRYWWQVYSLGFCNKDREGEVKAADNALSGNNGVHFICGDGTWRKATDIEKDTYKWESGKDGDVKNGDVVEKNCYVFEDSVWRSGNEKDCSLKLCGCTALRQDTVGKGGDGVWYICDTQNWRKATDIEKDTFGWKDSTDGAIKKGTVTGKIYLFDKNEWRLASSVESKLGGCVDAIADSVGKVESVYYICKSGKWLDAGALEYDTYKWAAGKDGDSKYGSVNAEKCYVFEDKAWRSGNANDCLLKLRGCTTLRQDTVALGSDKVWHICDSKSWRNATNIEKDTATWGLGTFNGEIRTGQINTTIYYIYESDKKAWRNATTLEKDTYDFTNNKKWPAGTDGEIKKGSVTDSIYVYDATAWRVADDIEKVLGGCVAAIVDSVGKVGSTYYICTPRKWNIATALQYDTYKKVCSEDGSIIDGRVNSENKYVCDGGVFRAVTENDIRAGLGCTSYTEGEFKILSGQYSYYKCESSVWNFTTEKINQGTMTDKRDGHVYKTIGIKNQMWMAENLNYQYLQPTVEWDSSSFCYNNDLKYCETYGRIYIWSAAMDSVGLYSSNGKGCGWGAFSENCSPVFPVRGVCPNGWHLPSYGEWNMLFSNVGGVSKAGSVLKSTSGWVGRMGNGSDTYGLSVFPAGDRHDYGDYYYDSDYGKSASFWSSSVNSLNDNGGGANAFRAYINGDYKDVFVEGYSAYSGFSVRCIKDEE